MRRLALCAVIATPLLARGDGYDFLARGKPAYARTAFRNQLRRNPGDLDSLVGLGISELTLGNPQKACEHLLDAIERAPDNAPARNALAGAMLDRARARMATGRFDSNTRYLLLDAAKQAQQAAALEPRETDPRVLMAGAYFELNELDQARWAIEEAEKRGASGTELKDLQGELICFRAMAQMEAGEAGPEAALDTLRELSRQDPNSAVLHFRIGDLLHMSARYDEALDAYGEGLAIDPFHRPCLELLLTYLPVPALEEKTRRILESTAKAASKAVSGKDPRPGLPLYCVGQAQLLHRDYQEATRLFRRALGLDPALEIPCQFGIGESSFRDGRHEDAESAYLRAIRCDREELVVRVQHLGLSTSVASSLAFLADRAVNGKRRGDARDLLSVVVDLVPSDASRLNDYAFLSRETGRHEESYQAYSRLIELVPRNPRYLNDTALILQYHLRREPQRARELYQMAIEAAQSLLEDASTPEAARESARSALKDARQNLSRLDGKTPPAKKKDAKKKKKKKDGNNRSRLRQAGSS